MVNQLTKAEKKNSVIFGAVAGIVSIIFSVMAIYHSRLAESYSSLYLVSTVLKIIGTILVPIGLVYFLKRKNNKVWTFSRALQSIYIFLATSIVLSAIGITVFQKVLVDKAVLEESYQNLMNLKIVDMESREATDVEIDQQMEIIEQDRAFAFSEISFKNTVPPVFISLLIHFIYAMVLALLFRDKIVEK